MQTLKKNILFISHDLNRAGAQLFILNAMRYLNAQGHSLVLLYLNEWGPLKEDFEEVAIVFFYKENYKKKVLNKKIPALDYLSQNFTFDTIYVNTIASVFVLEEVRLKFKSKILIHIHEMAYSINTYGPKNGIDIINKNADLVIACSQAVKENLNRNHLKLPIELVYSFVNNSEIINKLSTYNKVETKEKHNIPKDKFIVAACGNADWRKGSDLFLRIANLLKNENVYFIWVGMDKSSEFYYQLNFEQEKFGIDNILWIEPTPDALEIINAADVFLLSSREDPFPLVMLEAALSKLPVLGFKKAGGVSEFLENKESLLSDFGDLIEMSSKILALKNDRQNRLKMGEYLKNRVLNTFGFDESMKSIDNLI